MKAAVTISLCISVVLLIAACSVASAGLADNKSEATVAAVNQPDADAIALAVLSDKVVVRAGETFADAVLKQVGINTEDGRQVFRFTDEAATQVIPITVASDSSAADQWQVHIGVSPLTGRPRPGMLLHDLKIGPSSVVETATKYWEGCNVTGLGLGGEGSKLVWHVFCGLPRGVVRGSVDGRTRVFTPSNAPPARIPPTEEPKRQKKQ